jgi:hypothetical protein
MTIISMLSCIFISSVFAQSRPLSIETGKPVILKWSDTHQGILKYQPRISPPFTIPFTVHENLCSNSAGQSCKLKTQLTNPLFVVVWYKHPDNTKIGRPVSYGNESLENEDDIEVSAEFKKIYPQLTKNLSAASIECTDYSWIPGTRSAKVPPNQLKIARWESEFMLPNEDTGVTENRTIGGAINVSLEKSKENSLLIKDIQAITGDQFQVLSLVFGDNFSWVIKDATGESCQIAFKPGSLQEALSVSQQLRANTSEPSEMLTYIVGTDESLNRPDGVGSTLKNFWLGIPPEMLQ